MIKARYSLTQRIVPLLLALFAITYCWFNLAMILEFGLSYPSLVFGFVVSVILLVIAIPLTVYRFSFHVYIKEDQMEIQEWFSKLSLQVSDIEQVILKRETSGIQFTPHSFLLRAGRERLILKTKKNTMILIDGMDGYHTMVHHFAEK